MDIMDIEVDRSDGSGMTFEEANANWQRCWQILNGGAEPAHPGPHHDQRRTPTLTLNRSVRICHVHCTTGIDGCSPAGVIFRIPDALTKSARRGSGPQNHDSNDDC